MRSSLLLFVVLSTLIVIGGGCSLSPFHIFGTPLTKRANAEAKHDKEREAGGKVIQRGLHQAKAALDRAGTTPETSVAKENVNDATAMADQVYGAPTAKQMADFDAFVDGLLSSDPQKREAAQKVRSAQRDEFGAVSLKLAKTEEALKQKTAEAVDYAAKAEYWRDLGLKFVWGFGALVLLWLASNALSFASHFVPGLAPAAAIVGRVSAWGNQYVVDRMRDGAQRVGKAIGDMRAGASDMAKEVTSYLDAHTHDTPEFQALIKAAADKAHLSQISQ